MIRGCKMCHGAICVAGKKKFGSYRRYCDRCNKIKRMYYNKKNYGKYDWKTYKRKYDVIKRMKRQKKVIDLCVGILIKKKTDTLISQWSEHKP